MSAGLADWSMTVTSRRVGVAVAAVIVATLTDGGAEQGTFEMRLTPRRQLSVKWTGAEDAEPLAGFEAWSTA